MENTWGGEGRARVWLDRGGSCSRSGRGVRKGLELGLTIALREK